MSAYINAKYPWAVTVEGREVLWGGRRWRFAKGVPRPAGAATPECSPREHWSSIEDAARMFDLRPKLLRHALERGMLRARRFEGRPGPGSPVVYVALNDVAKIVPQRRGVPRRKSVRAEHVIGAVMFVDGLPVPVRERGRGRFK